MSDRKDYPLICPVCNGDGYVSDGQIEDGMMTGRMACPLCERGTITHQRFDEYVGDLWRRAHGLS